MGLTVMSILSKQIHNLIQGSAAWHDFREVHHGASEVRILLGANKYIKYADFLKWKVTGIQPAVSDFLEHVYQEGHKSEKELRPLVEEFIGDYLSPCVYSKGNISASTDGITFDELIAWETKQHNAKNYKLVESGILPEEHVGQCQQILYVTEAEKLYFTIAAKDNKSFAGVWVYPDLELHKKIVSVWEQFDNDVEEGKERLSEPVIEAKKSLVVVSLPVPSVLVKGGSISHNVDELAPKFELALSNAKISCVTEDDFGIAQLESKEFRLAAKNCVAMAKSIEVVRTLTDFAKRFDEVAITQEKLVAGQKEILKNSAKKQYDDQWVLYVTDLEKIIQPVKLVVPESLKPNWIEAMKHQQNQDGIVNKLKLELAKAKAVSNTLAKEIKVKLEWFNSILPASIDVSIIAPDLQDIIYKSEVEFRSIVFGRIHEAQTAKNEIETPDDAEISDGELISEENIPGVIIKDIGGGRLVNTAVVKNYDAVRPSKQDVIKTIAHKYWTTEEDAEKWLIEYFQLPF
jgi:hypothetical protein